VLRDIIVAVPICAQTFGKEIVEFSFPCQDGFEEVSVQLDPIVSVPEKKAYPEAARIPVGCCNAARMVVNFFKLSLI
jgi:hypothetical protein